MTRKITEIIIHCAATPVGKDFHARDIDTWHKARGFKKIGYHYVIDLDGTIETGRDLNEIGAHCAGHNRTSIGVCYIGGCALDGKTPMDTRTPAQKDALRRLLSLLKKTYPAARILSHHDLNISKACPSFDATIEYSDL